MRQIKYLSKHFCLKVVCEKVGAALVCRVKHLSVTKLSKHRVNKTFISVSGCKISVHQLVFSEVLHSFGNLKAHVNHPFFGFTDLHV